MEDGRHFTDYRPKCLTSYVSPNDMPLNSYEYRQYLIHNADQLMKGSRLDAYNNNMCGPCVEPYDIGTMLPEQALVMCDTNTCRTIDNDPNGLGTGRQFNTQANNKPRNEFLKAKQNEQVFMRQNINCCSTAEDDIKYFPYDKAQNGTGTAPRFAVPGGGIPMTGG
jgi:hypothetical protein